MERKKRTERNEFGLPNIIIPAEVLANKNLTAREMILFGYLLNMTYNEHGYCWASNRYLGRLLGVVPTTISAMLGKLADEQYIIIEYETRVEDSKQVRKVYINNKYPETYREMLKEKYMYLKKPLGKKQRGLRQNSNPPKSFDKRPLGKSLSNINNRYSNRDSNILLSDPKGSDSDTFHNSSHEPSHKIPSLQERNKQYLPLASKLADIIRSSKNIKITRPKLRSWSNPIRQLVEIDGVSIDRINSALNWYEKNIGGEYVPVIESGTSLRSKFIKLEAAIQRSKKGNGSRPARNRPTQAVRKPPGKRYPVYDIRYNGHSIHLPKARDEYTEEELMEYVEECIRTGKTG